MRVVQTLCRWDRAVYPRWIHPDKLLIDIGGLRPHSQLLTTGCCPPSRPSWTRNTFTLVFYTLQNYKIGSSEHICCRLSQHSQRKIFTNISLKPARQRCVNVHLTVMAFVRVQSNVKVGCLIFSTIVRLNGFRGAVSGKRPNAPWGHLYKIQILLRPYWLPI